MTLDELRDSVHERFPTHQSFVLWKHPVTWDGLTITNDTPVDAPDYIRSIKITWKGDYVSHMRFDHDLVRWGEARRNLAFRLFKELERFNG
jgi:hypothetical protein